MTVFSKMTAKCWTLPETGFRPCAFSPIMDPDQICHHTRLYTSLVKALEFWDLGFFFFFFFFIFGKSKLTTICQWHKRLSCFHHWFDMI